MRAMNKEMPKEKRILELNGTHPLIEKVKGLAGEQLADAIELLYSLSLVAEGSPVPNPARFAKLCAALMLK